ncbi:MAG: MFS transporter, partial [Deltaproteobacteria bacterium]|nr:MFS transporter [Deltaproteobacteria bacterium]
VEDRQRGSLMSLVVAIGQLGGGLGAAMAGLVYANVGFVGCSLLAAVSIFGTAFIVSTRLPEPERGVPEAAVRPA